MEASANVPGLQGLPALGAMKFGLGGVAAALVFERDRGPVVVAHPAVAPADESVVGLDFHQEARAFGNQ